MIHLPTKKALDAAASEATGTLRDGTSRKKNRTVRLDDANFRRLKSICAEEGKSVSEIIDVLIAAFLKQHKDNIKRGR